MNPLDRFLLPAGTPSPVSPKAPEAPTTDPTTRSNVEAEKRGEGHTVDTPVSTSPRSRFYAQPSEKKMGLIFEENAPPHVEPEENLETDQGEPPEPTYLNPAKLTPSQRIAHALPGTSRVKSAGITLSNLERDAVFAEAVRHDMTFSAYVRLCLFSETHVPKRPHGEKQERLGGVLRNRRKEQWIKQNVEAGLLPDPTTAASPPAWGVRASEKPTPKAKK